MSTLWKRATARQYRVLKIVRGAVLNAAHAHAEPISHSFANSVAKRAAGTLTAQWPDVLAMPHQHRQEGVKGTRGKAKAPKVSSYTALGLLKGDRLRLHSRSPIKKVMLDMASNMRKVNTRGVIAERNSYIKILRLLAQAQNELLLIYESQQDDRRTKDGSQDQSGDHPGDDKGSKAD